MALKKTLLMVANVDWVFIMHRMAIGQEALNNGFEVVVAAKDTGSAKEIRDCGMKFIDLNISRSGVNPFTEFKLMVDMYKLYHQIQPAMAYHVTMKPVIYGSIISRILKIKTVNAISGLGYNFTDKRRGFIQKVMVQFMKWGFNKENNYLIFENEDDLNELQQLDIVNTKNKVQVIKGVGVNLQKYTYKDEVKKEKVVILLPTRMLWDKGVKEFVEAAKLLKGRYQGKVLFELCGMADTDNKEGVPASYLRSCQMEDYLKWIGHQKNMPAVYKEADIVVLPSYREGMPTALIEACSAGKPIITTNAIGCRECVEEGLNGYKVPVKSVDELANAIEKLIVSADDRKRMGIYSRKKAELEFDQKVVVKKHLEIYNDLL